MKIGQIAKRWHSELEPYERKRILALAQSKPVNIIVLPQVLKLTELLTQHGLNGNADQIATLALALALVDKHSGMGLGTAMATVRDKFGKVVYTRKMAYPAFQSFSRRSHFVRFLSNHVQTTTGFCCNIERLAEDIWFWNNNVRVELALQYARAIPKETS